MDRRTFMSWVGLGFVATSLPVAIAACSSDTAESPTADAPADAPPPPPPGAPAREDGFVEVGTVADLDANGAIADKDFSAGPLSVFRDPANSEALIAVNATCAHQGCVADWSKDAGLLICPCHGSKFNPDGSIDTGPVEKPLDVFEVKIDGEAVLVKA
ncbi:MAG: Rieske 2Fe-2S domain-containing protein [Cyanobacteria bacterium P01_A01_bin.17]